MFCTKASNDYFGNTIPKHAKDELWINNGTEPEWIDPGKCSDSTGAVLIDNLFAGLLDVHPETLAPIPDIATHWDISADGRTYTFYLRDSTWSDGTKLTADDFVWSWQRVLDPATASTYSSVLYVLKNGAAFNRGQALRDDVGVHALNAATLRIELEEAAPYFLYLTTFHTLKPVPRHVLAKLAANNIPVDQWTKPDHIVSNGPYVLAAWRFKQAMHLLKNKFYWDAAHVALRYIKILEIENSHTALNLYHAGELDWLGSNTALPAEFISHMQRFKDTHQVAQMAVYFYWFNMHAPPLDNLKVRQALHAAIDRQTLVHTITRGGEIATADLVPDNLGGYHSKHLPLFDPQAAKRLLAEAGYPNGKKFPTLSLIYNTADNHKQLAEAVQAMWKQHLNIDVTIDNQEWRVFLNNVQNKQFQIARMSWVGDYPDANTFLHELLTHDSGNNASGFNNPLFDALLQRASSTLKQQKRLALLEEAEHLAMQQRPLTPLFVYSRTYTRKPYIHGFWDNYQDRHPFKAMWIE